MYTSFIRLWRIRNFIYYVMSNNNNNNNINDNL